MCSLFTVGYEGIPFICILAGSLDLGYLRELQVPIAPQRHYFLSVQIGICHASQSRNASGLSNKTP